MALNNPRPKASLTDRRVSDPSPPRQPSARAGAARSAGLSFPRPLGGGRARQEAPFSGRPGPALAPGRTLTLVDGLESASEIAILAITVHFTPERRNRYSPTAAARHLRVNAGGEERPLPRKRISEVA